jgi:MFS family permease
VHCILGGFRSSMQIVMLFVKISLTFHKTIVATALPTIVADLGGGNNYSWVGRWVYVILGRYHTLTVCSYSAYMLASASLGPLYGKLSNIVGQCHFSAMFTYIVAQWYPQAVNPSYMDLSSYS